MDSVTFQPIGYINSCYQEKFGVPRQPNLVLAAKAQLPLMEAYNEESVRGLEAFSHLWIQFVFHKTADQSWKPMVRPPRLGGNKKVGVFASRSNFRPNPIGLSVVKLDKIELSGSHVILHLLGCDLINQTPVLDIKPYIPYADSLSEAQGGYAKDEPMPLFDVDFTDEAMHQSNKASLRFDEDIMRLITQILSFDPRPSYQQSHRDEERIYRMKLYDFDLSWQYCENNKIKVLALNTL